MKKSRFTEEQIITALKEVEAGRKVQEVTRKMGVSEVTFYRWKAKFGVTSRFPLNADGCPLFTRPLFPSPVLTS